MTAAFPSSTGNPIFTSVYFFSCLFGDLLVHVELIFYTQIKFRRILLRKDTCTLVELTAFYDVITLSNA